MEGTARPRIGGRASGRALGALLVTIAAAALGAPAADGRDFNCDASALRMQLGSQTIVEPVTANRGAAVCNAVLNQSTSAVGPLTGTLLAQTGLTGVTDAQARGGLAFVSVSRDALTGISLPTLDAVNALPAVTVPIPLAGQLLGLPSSIQVDIRPAVNALVTAVNSAPLLEVQGSVANARAGCADGKPLLSGESQVAGLKVLGQTLPTDAIVQQALTLYNGQTINPGGLDLSKVVLPAGLSFTDPVLGTILQTAVQDALAALPAITLPASLVDVSVTPSSQITGDGGLTQRGLRIALSVLGNNVLAAILGEARISNDSVTCAVNTPAGSVAPLESLPKAALSCSTRRLALIDVLDRGRYVALYGAADLSLAGRRVAIRSLADGGRVVARPRVSKSGLFQARAPLPPARYRFSNRARYMAVSGKDKSLNLKLHRRMYFESVRSRNGRVVLSGLVTKPHVRNTLIVVRQRLTCRKQRVVARVRPGADGRFRVALRAPRKGDVGVYRATTIVAYPGGGPDFRTYTLPGLVRFAR